jgi:hypothetical protein
MNATARATAQRPVYHISVLPRILGDLSPPPCSLMLSTQARAVLDGLAYRLRDFTIGPPLASSSASGQATMPGSAVAGGQSGGIPPVSGAVPANAVAGSGGNEWGASLPVHVAGDVGLEVGAPGTREKLASVVAQLSRLLSG